MKNKFIIVVTKGRENTVYVSDSLIDAEGFLENFCEDIISKDGKIYCNYSNYASGKTKDGLEVYIEIFVPGEYMRVPDTNYFKENC